jgi:hypothetical protein
MRRYLLLVFLFASVAHAAPKSPPKAKIDGDCSRELTKLYRVFQKDVDGADAAYVGISHETLLALLKKGHLTNDDFISPALLRLTKENPTAAKIIQLKSGYPNEPWSKQGAIDGATTEATEYTNFEILRDRIAGMAGSPLSADGKKMLFEVLTSMRDLDFMEELKPAKTRSPTWVQLRHVIGETEIEFDDAKIVGDNYEEQKFNQRILRFLKTIGFPETDVQDPRGAAQRRLVAIFSRLPNQAGYVIGLKFSPEMEQDPDGSVLSYIKTDDIASIEPLGNDEFNYLANLAPKKKAAKPK